MRKERIWVKPSPPKPDQLQLTTNARSLTRSEFLEKYPNEFDYYFMKSNTGQSSNETSQTKIECSNEETRSLRTIMGNLVRTLLDDSYMQQLLREQQQEKPFYFAQLEGANWPPRPNSNQTSSKNRLIASIMAMDDQCPPTPVNSSEGADSTPNQIEEQLDDLKTLESVMSEMLKNVLSSASSGETILTAKPINIVQK